MGKIIAKGSKKQVATNKVTSSLDLNREETQFLLNLLGDSTFKVKDIEFIYKLVLKLQDHFITFENRNK